MGRKNEQSWLCQVVKFWTITFVVFLVGAIVAVEGVSDICKQQQQSSFQLKKLGSAKSSKRCADLCCKETKCHIPLRVKHHCYSISCAKEELCQIVFEQLKDFEGHRVDKRDVDESEEDDDWQHDHGQDLSVYQKKDLFDTANATLGESELTSSNTEVNGGSFAAFLLQETGIELARNARELTFNNAENQGNTSIQQAPFAEENKIYVNLNDTQDGNIDETGRVLKRSTDDDDDDEDEDDEEHDNDDKSEASSENPQCSHDEKFDHSAIPVRKKNYNFKRLEKKSKSLASCSKKCCKTENCILSFLVEKTCFGVLCSGDGDCHVKKEKLPRTKFELSLVKREVKSSSESNHDDNAEKRSSVSSKDGDVDGDTDEDVDGEKEEVKASKKKKKSKKKKPQHKTKAHKNKQVKKHSKKSKKHKDEGDGDDVDNAEKKSNKSNKKKKNTKKIHKHKKEKIQTQDDDASGEEDETKRSSKKHHVKMNHHKRQKKKNDDEENSDKEAEEGDDRPDSSAKESGIDEKKNDGVEDGKKEKNDDDKEEQNDKKEEKEKENDTDKEELKSMKEDSKSTDSDTEHDKRKEESSNDSKEEDGNSTDDENGMSVNRNNGKNENTHKNKQTDEYSDDVKHLSQNNQRPQNSTLFDDTVVGDETLNDQDPDGKIDNGVSNRKDSVEPDSKEDGITEDLHESRYEEGYASVRNAEETAGRDESLEMRKAPFADNDKSNDLMVAHRHYEDVEEVGGGEDPEERTSLKGAKEDDDDEEERPRYRTTSKHNRNYKTTHRNDDYYRDDDYDSRRQEQRRDHSKAHLKSHKGSHRHNHHENDSEEGRDDDSGEIEQDEDHHYITFLGSHDHKENNEDIDDRKHHHYLKFHGSKKINSEDDDSPPSELHKHAKSQHHKKSRRPTKTSKSHTGHTTRRSKSKQKKHSPESLDKEEKLIDRLEHLEETIESKQKKVLEERKKKILDKVDSLTDSLDNNGNKKEKKSHKDNKVKKKKHQEINTQKQSAIEMENVADFSKQNTEQSEEIVIPQNTRRQEFKLNEGSGEQESGSGDFSNSEKESAEEIVIPKKSGYHKYKVHHAKADDNDSGSGDAANDIKQRLEKFKTGKSSAKHHEKHKSHSHKSKSKKNKSKHKSEKPDGKKADEKVSDGSGSGEEEDEHEDKKQIAFEQRHRAEKEDWSQRDIVIPYVDNARRSHHGQKEMPALNEDMVGLSRMNYEKKDIIAKPSDSDVTKDKKSKVEKHKKSKEEDSRRKTEEHKSSHKKSKSHKDKKKSKKKASKKHKSKNDLMKDFERYEEFLKAKQMAASGEGSGDEEASGENLISFLKKEEKKHRKSKNKHHVEKKSKHKTNKETKKKKEGKKMNHHKKVIDSESSGDDESEASSGEQEEVISKKHKEDHKHKKTHNKSNAEKREGHKDPPKQSERAVVNTTSVFNATELPKVLNKTETSQGSDSLYSHARMFKDRKESSSNEETSISTTASQRGVPSNTTINHGSAPTSKTNQVQQPASPQQVKNLNPNTPKPNSKVVADSNNSVGGEESKKPPKVENQQTLKNSQNSTVIARKPTTKGNTATKTATKQSTKLTTNTTTRPTTKATTRLTTTPTTKQTTKLTTTPKPSTTARTTRKKKAIAVKPTRPAKRGTPKPKHKKATKRVSTTYIPTLNIMTGDEDVNTGNIEPPTVKQKSKHKQHSAEATDNHSDKKKRKKEQGNVAHKPMNDEKIRPTMPPRITRTVPNPVLPNHYGSLLLHAPTAPPIATFTANPYSHQKPQPVQGQTGSAGTLGDIQLPEPPGNGNIIAGPPYYKQQGLPGDFPMPGTFGRNGIQQTPFDYQPKQGHPQSDWNQRMNNGLKPQEYQHARMTPTVPLGAPFDRGMPAQLPPHRPTPKPHTKPYSKPKATNSPNNQDKAAQSARKVIERILHKPKPTDSSLISHVNQILTGKKSPIDVIHDILGQHRKQALHPTNAARHMATTDKKKKFMGPEGRIILKNRPTLPHKEPTSQRKLEKAKEVPQKQKKKPMANRLNDFFNKVNNLEPAKTTVKPKAVVPKQNLPHVKVPQSSAPVSPQQKKEDECSVSQTLDNFVLVKGRQAGQFTKIPGYPDLPTCIKECCKMPTCDVLFKSGEVCYLVHCNDQQSCKTEPSKEPTIHTRVLLFHKPQPKAQPAKPAICEEENAFGISWKATKPGSFATRPCPREAKGMARRQCRDHARWFTPDFSGCISDEYTNLHNEVKQLGFTASVRDVVSKLEDITTQTIDNSMIFGGDLVKATTILDGLSNYVVKNHAERFGFQALRKFARSASNLLDETNKQEWENAHQVLPGPGKIMKALENFGLVTAGKIPPANNMQPVVTNNMVMSVAHLSNIKKYVFPNYSMPILKKWTTKRDSIILPGSLFKSGIVKVASINYKTLAQFLPHQWNTANHVTFTDGFRVNSKVLSSAIFPKPRGKISPPVTIVLHHLKEVNSARTKCVYWDFTVNVKNGGSWSSDGCWVVTSNSTVTVCQCDHLTHFAVLMNLNDEDRISAKEQAKENTFALMWLGIPILVVLSVGAMYTCFAWTKAPRRRHVVVKDGKPRLPDDEVIVTNTIKEDFPGSPNRYLYSSYNSPSPSDLEWEHAWDFLTNSEFENWQDGDASKRKRPRKKRLEIRPPRILRDRRKKHKEKLETSEYFSDGNSSSFRWKHQDDNVWSRDRIKCLGKGIVDVSSEASQPVDSLEEFSDVTSIADSKDGDKCSNSFDTFSPDAISSPRLGYCTEPKYYSFVYKSDTSLKERDSLRIAFNAASEFSSERRTLHNSCSSLETLRTLQPAGVQKVKYASTSSLCTIGQRSFARLIERKWNSKISLSSSHSVTHSMSSGFLDKTWSSKYASSLSISTFARSVSARTINEDVDYLRSGCESVSEELGYGTFESSTGLSNEIMDMNISTVSDVDSVSARAVTEDVDCLRNFQSSTALSNEVIDANIGIFGDADSFTRMAESAVVNKNIPTYDTNLLTPSKKPVEVICRDGFENDSSLNSSWIDDLGIMEDYVTTPWNGATKGITIETKRILDADVPKRTEKAIFEDILSKLLSTENDIDVGIDRGNVQFDSFSADEGIALEIQEPAMDNHSVKADNERAVNISERLESDCKCGTRTDCRDSRSSIKTLKKSSTPASKQTKRNVTIPRTLKTKRKTQPPRTVIEKAAKSNAITRSPSKHMRSYIALRQQSRYSDHEKQGASASEEKPAKRRKKKILPKRQSMQKYIESEDSEYTKDEVEESHVIDVDVACVVIESERTVEEENVIPEEAFPVEELIPCPEDDSELENCEEVGDKMRRCVETSVFGMTLKRWKGQSRLYKTLKK